MKNKISIKIAAYNPQIMRYFQLFIAKTKNFSARNAICGTGLSDYVAGRLVKLFQALPKDLEVAMVEEVKVSWMEAHHLHGKDSEVPNFPGKAELVAFFSWFDFCDDLIKVMYKQVYNTIQYF